MIDETIRSIVGFGIVDIARILAIIFAFLYLLFSFVILRQVQLMTRTLPTPISPVLIFISIAQIGVTLMVIVLLLGVL